MTNDKAGLSGQIQNLSGRPIDDVSARSEMVATLDTAEEDPSTVAGTIDDVIELLMKSVRARRLARMIDGPCTVTDVRDAALAVLESAAADPQIDVDADTIVRRVSGLYPDCEPPVRIRLLRVVGQCGGGVEAASAKKSLRNMLSSAIQGPNKATTDERITAVETAGRLLATGVTIGTAVVDLLEAAFETGRPETQAAVARAAGRGLTGPDPPVERLEALLDLAQTVPNRTVTDGVAEGACIALDGPTREQASPLPPEEVTSGSVNTDDRTILPDSGDVEQSLDSVDSNYEVSRTVGQRLLNDLLDTDDPVVQESVSRAIGNSVGEVSSDTAKLMQTFLSKTLEEVESLDGGNDDTVEAAAIDAAIKAVRERSDTVEPFVSLIRPIIKANPVRIDGEVGGSVVAEMDQAVWETVLGQEIVDVDTQDVRDLAERAALDSRGTEKSIQSLDLLSGTHGPEFRRPDVPDTTTSSALTDVVKEDTVDEEESTNDIRPSERNSTSDSENSDDDGADEGDSPGLSDRIGEVIEVVPPSRAEQVFANVNSLKERKSILSAVPVWSVDEGETAKPQEILYTAWRSGGEKVREHTLRSASVSVEVGGLDWETVEPLFERARKDSPATVRVSCLLGIAGLLTDGAIDWETARPWIDAAVSADEPVVSVAGLQVITEGLSTVNLEWEDVRSYLERARGVEETIVVKEALATVENALLTEAVDWSDAKPYVDAVKIPGSKASVEKASLVSTALEQGIIDWNQAEEHLLPALTSDSKAVAAESVFGVCDALAEDEVSCGAVRKFCETAFQTDIELIVKRIVAQAGIQLSNGSVQWADVQWVFRKGWATNVDEVRKIVLIAVRDAWCDNQVGVGNIAHYVRSGLLAEHSELMRETVNLLLRTVTNGPLRWREVLPWMEYTLKKALKDDREEIATEVVRRLFYLLTNKDDMTGTDIRPFFLMVVRYGTEPVLESFTKLTGSAIANRHIRMDEVIDIFESIRVKRSESAAASAVLAVSSCISNGTVRLTTVSGFIEEALRDERRDVVKRAYQLFLFGVVSGSDLRIDEMSDMDSIEGDVALEYLPAIFDSGVESVMKEAVWLAVLIGVHGRENWPAVFRFIRKSIAEAPMSVQKKGIRALGPVLASGDVTWDVVGKFFRSVVYEYGIDHWVADAVAAGLAAGAVNWEDINFLIDRVHDETVGNGFSRSWTASAIAEGGLQGGEIDWSQAEPLLRIGWDADGKSADVHIMASLLPLKPLFRTRSDIPPEVIDLLDDASEKATVAQYPLAEVVDKALTETDVEFERFQSLLHDLMMADHQQTRLKSLNVVRTGLEENANADTLLKLIDKALEDPNERLRYYALRLLGDILTRANGHEQMSRPMLDRALDDSSEYVQSEAVVTTQRLLETCNADMREHYLAKLREVAAPSPQSETGWTDPTVENPSEGVSKPSAVAIKTLVEDCLSREMILEEGDPLVDILTADFNCGGETTCRAVRRERLKGVRRLLEEGGEFDKPVRDRFEKTLWKGLKTTDQSVRRAAATAIAESQSAVGIDIDVPNWIRKTLRGVITEDDLPVHVRLELVQALSRTEQPVTGGLYHRSNH